MAPDATRSPTRLSPRSLPVVPSTPSPVPAASARLASPAPLAPAADKSPSLSLPMEAPSPPPVKTEAEEDELPVSVVPSSLTPPPSAMALPAANDKDDDDGDGDKGRETDKAVDDDDAAHLLVGTGSSPSSPSSSRRPSADYLPSLGPQLVDASARELRSMLRESLAEQQRLKMEAAHHRLQYHLLNLQADEESKRAAVEHDMVRREVDVLRTAEQARQAKRELEANAAPAHANLLQMQTSYEQLLHEKEALALRLRAAKKVIQQMEEEAAGLKEERQLLLTRIRENRQHFQMLCSPGGIFHAALTPKKQPAPASVSRSSHSRGGDGGDHGLSALLQAMSQEDEGVGGGAKPRSGAKPYGRHQEESLQQGSSINNSAPCTPLPAHRAAYASQAGRHNRKAQSMSSLPTTPVHHHGSGDGLLLAPAGLTSQAKVRYPGHQAPLEAPSTPPTPRHGRQRRRKSRESTISVDEDGQELMQLYEEDEGEEEEDDEEEEDEEGEQGRARGEAEAGEERGNAADGESGYDERGELTVMGDRGGRVVGRARGPDKRKLSDGGAMGSEQPAAQAGDMGEDGSPSKRLRAGGEEWR